MTTKRIVLTIVLASVSAASVTAQTRSVRDTATAYGARLDARGRPADLNPNRINSRIDSRVNGRLSLRIERYRVDSTANPTAAFQAPQDDGTRRAAVIAPPPPQEDDPR